jgi:hypothetical protein
MAAKCPTVTKFTRTQTVVESFAKDHDFTNSTASYHHIRWTTEHERFPQFRTHGELLRDNVLLCARLLEAERRRSEHHPH